MHEKVLTLLIVNNLFFKTRFMDDIHILVVHCRGEYYIVL